MPLPDPSRAAIAEAKTRAAGLRYACQRATPVGAGGTWRVLASSGGEAIARQRYEAVEAHSFVENQHIGILP